MTGCSLIVPPSVFKRFLAPESHEKYRRWVVKKFAQCSSKLRECPKVGCRSFAFCAYVPTDSYHEVPCGCGQRWCFTCGEEDHRPAICSQVTAWNTKANDLDLTAMYIRANTKKCPQCQLEIVKDEGCAHMKCTQCGFHFCWLCLGDYASHNEKTGGFYACNRFEARVLTEGRTEDEKRALAAARALKCYEMAFERHLNHKGALEAAERELLAQVPHPFRPSRPFVYFWGAPPLDAFPGNRLRQRCARWRPWTRPWRPMPASRTTCTRSDRLWRRYCLRSLPPVPRSSSPILTRRQVVSSRRILAWSYVFKFYQFENETLERELQLYETYQGKLEHMTEDLQSRLSDLSASRFACYPVSRFDEKCVTCNVSLYMSSSRGGRHSGGRGGGGGGGGSGGGGGGGRETEGANFGSWKQGVVHLMGAVKSFAQNVVSFAENAEVGAFSSSLLNCSAHT